MLPVMGQFNRALASSPGSYDWTLDVSLFPMTLHAITHFDFTFVTPLLNAPHGANLAWTAMNYAWALAFSPIADVWGVIAGYNAMVFFSLVTNGVAMYWALRHWVEWRLAAFIGGALFMFSPFVIGQTLANHLQLVSVWTLPMIAVLMYRAMVTQDESPIKTGMLLGALLFVQAFTSEEVEAQVILFGVGIGLIWMWGHRSQVGALKHAVRTVAWSIPLAACGVGIVTYAQLFGGNAIHGLAVGAAAYSADVFDFVLPGHWSALTVSMIAKWVQSFTPAPGEATAYIGIPMIAIAAALWFKRSTFDLMVFGVAAAAVILMLGPSLTIGGRTSELDVLPMALIGRLPMLENLLPDRISLILDIAMAIIVARFIDKYLRSRPPILLCGLLLLTIGSWLPVLPSAIVPPTPTFFQHQVPTTPKPIFLVLPFAQVSTTTTSEYWQAVANDDFAMTGGNYGSRPVGVGVFTDGPTVTRLAFDFYCVATYGRLAYPLNEVGNFNDYLKEHHVSAIVVGPEPHEKMMVAVVERLTHTQPRATQGVFLWTVPLNGFHRDSGSTEGPRG